MDKNKIDLKTVLSIASMLIMALFWVFTINGIPKRVEALETDVGILKTDYRENKAKIDTIYDDVQIIKQYLIKK